MVRSYERHDHILSTRRFSAFESDHLGQRGSVLSEQPMESSVNAASGQITVRYKNKNGEEKTLQERHELPPDVANGLLFTLLC